MNYVPDQTSQECEDRIYWHKRFNFASWLFLIFGFWAIFASSTAASAILGVSVSLGFRLWDSICYALHMRWHMENNDKGNGFHL